MRIDSRPPRSNPTHGRMRAEGVSMHRVRRWRVGLSLVAIAAALGWWGLSSSKPSAPEEAGVGGGDVPSLTAAGLAAHPRAPAASPAPIDAPGPGGTPQPRESRIEGTVRRDGKPAAARVGLHPVRPIEARLPDTFEDARVEVEEARGPASNSAEAGDDGHFAFVGVAPGTYVLRAVASDGAYGSAYAQLHGAGARDVADLALEPRMSSVHGRVVHADGTSWRGDVLVHAMTEGQWWSRMECAGSGVTDGEGRFAVSRLPVGRVVVSAIAANGGRVYGAPVLLPSAEEYTIVWEADRVAVEGRVVAGPDRAPVEEAEVVGTTMDGLLESTDRTRTGADGRFRVLVPKEEGTVSARARGYVPASLPVDATSKDVELVLGRAGRIRGIVTRRGGGGPVVGAEVRLVREGRNEGWRPDLSVRTDGDGRFEAEDLAPASYFLVARGEGYVSAAFLAVESAARTIARVTLGAGDDLEVVLESVPGARIVGTVKDAEGGAVEGATVHASRRPAGRLESPDEPSWSAYGSDSVASGPGGEFEISSLVPGVEYTVSASARARPDSGGRLVKTTNDAPASVDLVLPRARWILVTVVEAETDAPIAGAYLEASTFADESDDDSGLHFASSTSTAAGTTDAAGRARVGPLGEGQVLLSVEAAGFATRAMDELLGVVEGQGGPSATVRLVRARRVSGRVLRPDGDPASGAWVWLRTATSPGHWTSTSVQAGEDGTFSFEGLGDGDRSVRATLEAEGLGSEPVPAPAGAVGLTLRLTDRYVVARVLDADGHPVPSAKATYSHGLPSGGSSTLNGRVKHGRLAIDVDEASPTTTGALTVSEAADEKGQRLPLGTARIEGVRPGQEVVVRLPRELTIEGRVLGPDGTGVAGVMVRAARIEGDFDPIPHLEAPWVWTVSAFVRTDATGAFRIGQLSEGPHVVAALPSPSYAPPATVRRDAGTTSVDFRLRPSTSATVTVLGPQGTPIEGAQVVAVRNRNQAFLMHELFSEYATGWSTTATTSADGRAVLLGLDPDATFVLGARAPSSASLADSIVKSWRPADTILRLGAGLPVAGVARDAAGTPLHGAYVDCQDSNGVSRSVVTGEDGSFRFTGLAAGAVQLEARFDDDEQKEKPRRLRVRTSVPAGSEVVGLRLR